MESIFYNWITTVTGLETVQEPYEGLKPTGDHASFQVLSIKMSENEHNHKTKISDLVIENKFENHAELQLSVNITGYQAYQHLAELKMSGNQWSVRQALLPHTLNMVGEIQNRNYLNHTSQKHRWGADFEFMITLTHQHDLERLNNLYLGGDWSPTHPDTLVWNHPIPL
jgi:hypothetical protein